MKRPAQIDPIHAEIIDALRNAGASAQSFGGPLSTLLVGYRSRTLVMHVGGNVTEAHVAWRNQWRGGSWCVVSDAAGAVAALKIFHVP